MTVKNQNMTNALVERINTMSLKLDSTQKRITALEKKLTKSEAKSVNLFNLIEGENITNARERGKELSALYEVVLFKTSVLTEVTLTAKQSSAGTGKAMRMAYACALADDKPDDWWMKKRSKTIAEWFGILDAVLVEATDKKDVDGLSKPSEGEVSVHLLGSRLQ